MKMEFINLSLVTFLIYCSLFTSTGFAESILELARNVTKQEMASVYQRMNLSERQKQKLESNRRQHHEIMQILTQQISSLKKELQKELANAPLDRAKVERLQTELKKLQAQRSDERLNGIMEVRQILTPQQYAIFSEIMQE